MHSNYHPCQTSFIANRHSSENIVVSQEVFHSMRSKMWKDGWMTIKIDLEKAYASLKWEFFHDTLADFFCLNNNGELIWGCMSGAK